MNLTNRRLAALEQRNRPTPNDADLLAGLVACFDSGRLVDDGDVFTAGLPDDDAAVGAAMALNAARQRLRAIEKI
jgi:hypothetical protein